MDCQPDDFGYISEHRWHYGRAPVTGSPYRECRRCLRVEAYYLDDLLAEQG